MGQLNIQSIPELNGKVIVVTGGNSGLGFESVKAFAHKGATVIMASRNEVKAERACQELDKEKPVGEIIYMPLDLASLKSVESFASTFKEKYSQLDILMNNAGIMAIPRFVTEDGFEMQFGTNHLGHFALTGRLFDLLSKTVNSRVVTVTSLAANNGRINKKDLMWERKYSRWGAYGQSKLANMLFGQELHRRLVKGNFAMSSVLAHPGFSATNLQEGPTVGAGISGKLVRKMLDPICQDQEIGALPQIYAATLPEAVSGDYFGPSKQFQMKGLPKRVNIPKPGRSESAARALWDLSVDLTGVEFLRK